MQLYYCTYMAEYLTQNPEFKSWVKMLMCLVLLPPEYILPAFERLMCAEFPNVSQLDRAKIFSFKKYMRKTWLNQFTPEFCLFLASQLPPTMVLGHYTNN